MSFTNKVRNSMIRSPCYIAVNLWNQIDDDIQMIDCNYMFKMKLNVLNLEILKLTNEFICDAENS